MKRCKKKKNNQKFFCHVKYCLQRAQSLFFTFWLGSSNLRDRCSRVVSLSAACCRHTDRSVMETKKSHSVFLLLADLLQQLSVDELELHADGHLGDELVAALLRHLLAAAQVDAADASAALEIGQRLVGDPVAHWTEERRGKGGRAGNVPLLWVYFWQVSEKKQSLIGLKKNGYIRSHWEAQKVIFIDCSSFMFFCTSFIIIFFFNVIYSSQAQVDPHEIITVFHINFHNILKKFHMIT